MLKAVLNWVEKFSQVPSKVATDDVRPGCRVEFETEATVQQVEELIRVDRKVTTDSAASALGCSHGLVFRIMHDHLQFRKVCALWAPR
jgi:hypothetical protein